MDSYEKPDKSPVGRREFLKGVATAALAAARAIYDAWCDRVPIYLVLGNTQDATERAGEVFWVHSAQDPAAIIRDMTKWDDNPVSLAHFAESAARAYAIAMTPPMGPVAIV